MVICLDCGKKRKTNSPKRIICWDDYQLCIECCIVKHPERYPLNVVKQITKNIETKIKQKENRLYYIEHKPEINQNRKKYNRQTWDERADNPKNKKT